jgi:hypothetical protein
MVFTSSALSGMVDLERGTISREVFINEKMART